MEPNADYMKLENKLISLEDFEYYENEEYNPMFMRTLGNSIYAINAIYRDFHDDTETLKSIFSYMPFGFGKLVNDDNKENFVLYTTSNEEHFYKSLNNEDFLEDLKDTLQGKKQIDFSFRKEGKNLDETYSGIIYEENAIFNLKNIIKNEFEELPNLIFYINSHKIGIIDKISKIFDFQLVNDEITNATIQIQPKMPLWGGISNVTNENNRIIDDKKYFGYNELDFVFLNKKEKEIEYNKIYYNILGNNKNIIFKKNYAYFVEIKLSFPSEPEKVIKHLFKKAKNLFSLYKGKYNMEHLGIILIYDSLESNGNKFCNSFNINFSNKDIDLHIIYLHVTVQVSNMNYLINKISKMEDKLEKTKTELGETKRELGETRSRLSEVDNFQKLLFSKLIEILPDKKEIFLSVEEELKNMKNQDIKEDIDKINPKEPKTVENNNENNINISSNTQIPVKNNADNSININLEHNENNIKNNTGNENYLDIDKNGRENVKDKVNNFEIQDSFNDNGSNSIIDNKTDATNDADNIEETPKTVNFSVIAGEFQIKVKDIIDNNLKIIKIKENIKNSLNIFEKLNDEITKFNNSSEEAYLKNDTKLKKFLSNSLFTPNITYLKDIYNILESIIYNRKSAISKEFIKLKNLLFGYKISYSSLFYKEEGVTKSFIQQFICNIIYLLENDSPENLDIYYSSLLKSIMEVICGMKSNHIKFYRLVKFCLLIYKNKNYSIEDFITNFIEGMNIDNEESLVKKQNSNVNNYNGFINFKAK